jgi:YVTN family beta-propeller protein
LICVTVSCLFTGCDSELALSGSNYTVGGTVSGLTGSGLVLDYVSGGDVSSTLTISSNGSFTFAPHVANGTTYSISVESQPVNPSQICTVSNGSGTVAGANVTSVIVNCAPTARFAYVANKLSSNISAYSVNSTTGALTPVAGSPFVSNGSQPDAVGVGPDGNYLYVANSASNDLGIFSINTATGLLSPLSTVPTGAAPYGIVVTGGHLYVSNYASNDISAYAIDAASGALTEISGSPFPVGVAPTSLKTDPSGTYLYVANFGSGSVSVLHVDSSSGALSGITGSPFPAGAGPISIAIDATGSFAYVANKAGATISEYSIDSSTGALTALPASPLATQSSPTSMATAGAYLVVTDVTQADELATFAIGGTGVLSFSGATQTGGSPVDLIIDPSGQFAYVVCEGSNNVFLYTVSGGALTPASPPSVTSGTGPVSIAIN